MARATGSPVPVMADTSDSTKTGVPAAKGKTGAGATSAATPGTMGAAVGSETHKTAAASTTSGGHATASRGTTAGTGTETRDNVEYLGGAWGASFIGKGPDGKAVKGLHWDRKHTRPDIHPYDEIEWELRTAAISSETGKTVFEQKDVEVPKSWSQLATNVVVSKYFRGHVGTPERETSVRQLIDRVVNTITAWAETQHYFATETDLKSFQAELTHLLVHQKMAFNSPVWFNVGIEPRPQCSACFINSVQDNMGSIMDLAK
ncbi:MAG TPA: hypothetical protein VGI98_09050, partial [Candidatus Limnocylindrales bacterium]